MSCPVSPPPCRPGRSPPPPHLLALMEYTAVCQPRCGGRWSAQAVRVIGLPAGLFADVASRPGTPREVHTGTVNEPGRRVARSLALLHGGDDLGGRYCAGNGGHREE